MAHAQFASRIVLVLLFLALPGWASGQWMSTPPTIDGNCGDTGYAQSGDLYMGWNNERLFFCNGSIDWTQAMIFHLDKDAANRPRSGSGANSGPSHYSIIPLHPFHSDLNLYSQGNPSYIQYHTYSGSGWNTEVTTGLVQMQSGNVREFSVPWSVIGGRPASFNWYVFTHARTSGALITVSPRNFNYTGYFYEVPVTAETGISNPFSLISYTGFVDRTISDVGLNSLIADGGVTTLAAGINIGGSIKVFGGELNINESVSGGALSVTDGSVIFNNNDKTRSFTGNSEQNGGTITLHGNQPLAFTNLTLTSGTFNLSNSIGGDIQVSGNLVVNGGTRNYNSRDFLFNGTGSISGSGTFAPPFLVFEDNSNVTLQRDISTPSLTIDAGGTLNADDQTISIEPSGIFTNNGAFDAGTGTINFLGSGFLRGSSVYTLHNVNARGRTEIPRTATINGTLAIKDGGYLAQTNSTSGLGLNTQLPSYGPSATLAIEGPFTIENYSAGWGDSGDKVPSNISIGGTGNVTFWIYSNRTVSGTLTLVANDFTVFDKLILGPNARITSFGTGRIYGNVTIQRELPLSGSGTGRFFAFGYPHHAAIPYRGSSGLLRNVWIQGATSGGNTTSGSPNIFTYNNAYTGATAAGAWTGLATPASTVPRGRGFLAYVFDFANFNDLNVNRTTLHNSVGDLVGENGTGEVSPTLSFAANSNLDLEGLNFIANPFAAPIHWHQGPTHMSTFTHVYDGYWVVNDNGTGFQSFAGPQAVETIGIHQGFFVRTTAGSPALTIKATAKNVPSGKTSSDVRVQIALQNTEGEREHQSVIRFVEEDSRGMNFLGALTTAYSLMYLEDEVGRKMDVIDLNANESGVLRFPLQIATTSAHSYALAITENSLPGEWQATLVDLTNGRRYPAESGARIEFVSEASTVEAPYSRFMLELQNGEATNAESVELPSAFVLSAPVPNPFRGATTLDLRVETAQRVTASLYDVLGREVAQLFHGDVAPGQVQQFRVNGEMLNAGVYFVRVEGESFTETRRLVRIQ